jgi:spermidine synthase
MPAPGAQISSGERTLLAAIMVSGINAIVTQVVLIRELISVLYGNEFVIGVLLANWMVLTGLGSLLGSRVARPGQPVRRVLVLLLVSIVLPSVTTFLVSYGRAMVFQPGTMIGFSEILVSTLLLLAPFCLASGFLFTALVQSIAERSPRASPALVYSWEAIGSAVGGLLFNLAAVYLLPTFTALAILAAINGFAAILLALHSGYRRLAALSGLAMLGVVIVALAADPGSAGRRLIFTGQDLVFHADTPYGAVVVTEQSGQKNVFENSMLLYSTGESMANEESVHYAMLQHPAPASVLLVSGGIAGTTAEILKYGVRRIDYVELNPWIILIGRRLTDALSDPRIHVITEDPRMFIANTTERYDVALINVPDPSTVQINRMYTVECLRQLKRVLNPGGVVSYGLTGVSDYYGNQARRMHSTLYCTLASEFRNVLIVPGEKNYFLASDSLLRSDVGTLTVERGIRNTYVNPSYIEDRSVAERSSDVMKTLDKNAPLNRDFVPVAQFQQLEYWLAYFRENPWISGIGVTLLLGLIVTRTNPVSFCVLVDGFVASSIEIVLIVAFQILYGYVFEAISLLIALFMAGLAIGSHVGQRLLRAQPVHGFITVQFSLVLFCLALPLVLILLRDAGTGPVVVRGMIAVMMIAGAALVGTAFSLGTRVLPGPAGSVGGTLYGLDLIGSAAGALLVASVLIPLVGLTAISWILAGVCFVAAVVIVLNKKAYAISGS